ncbi:MULTISPECIES: hypothetical protein [Bacillus]|uniref:hypothetical protein n=1 Tax=Bacillus TaxID=1386 RepID=UPI0006A8DD33|nr:MULTISPECIES: hypothetical protein [Bacillus]ARW38102.1 hypothetical protein S101267_01012 [Bacillus amyloliquefaciens]KYC92546.1 hypothetical protein B425_0874 [Bacillus amyloliquefaciens]MCA1231441.1 hypothetical protein [Bacillus velezensis]MCA1309541.1 hypothetical protein [Bacillus velezensis]MCA1329166.1 hypothetical protein [Bacillus velezensis]
MANSISLSELHKRLKTTGIPVSYSHFKVSDGKQAPPPPYILYFETETFGFYADNKAFKKIRAVEIELYTVSKDLEKEELIEKLLEDANLSYQPSETFIEAQQVFRRTYEVWVS